MLEKYIYHTFEYEDGCTIKVCKTCGRRDKVKMSSLQGVKIKCETCVVNGMRKDAQFYRWVEESGYTLVPGEKYVNGKDRIRVICPNGHERHTNAYGLQKYGCKSCGNNSQMYIYIIEMQETQDIHDSTNRFKIGISNRPARRATEIRMCMRQYYTWLEIVELFPIKDRVTARDMESQIFQKLKNLQVHGELKLFDGSTEIYEGSYVKIESAVLSVVNGT